MQQWELDKLIMRMLQIKPTKMIYGWYCNLILVKRKWNWQDELLPLDDSFSITRSIGDFLSDVFTGGDVYLLMDLTRESVNLWIDMKHHNALRLPLLDWREFL